MEQLVILLHVLIALFLIVLVLIQQGKGATMGSSFGSGASTTVFGSSGSGGFLIKLTAFFGFLFFVTSLFLGYEAVQHSKVLNVANAMVAPVAVTPATAPPAQPQQN